MRRADLAASYASSRSILPRRAYAITLACPAQRAKPITSAAPREPRACFRCVCLPAPRLSVKNAPLGMTVCRFYFAARAHSATRLRKSSKFRPSCSRENPKVNKRPTLSADNARAAPSCRRSPIVAMNFASVCSTPSRAGGSFRSLSALAHARKKCCAASEICSSGSRRRATIGSGKASAAARPISTTSLRKRKTARTNGSGSKSWVRKVRRS